MNFITPAYAQAAGAAGPTEFIMQLVPFAVILLIMYFMIMRPQQKRAKAHQEMISNIRRGDTVVTAGGIIAKVSRTVDDSEVEVAKASIKPEIVLPSLDIVQNSSPGWPSSNKPTVM
jgi:preprotein translocase subunit YajC